MEILLEVHKDEAGNYVYPVDKLYFDNKRDVGSF